MTMRQRTISKISRKSDTSSSLRLSIRNKQAHNKYSALRSILYATISILLNIAFISGMFVTNIVFAQEGLVNSSSQQNIQLYYNGVVFPTKLIPTSTSDSSQQTNITTANQSIDQESLVLSDFILTVEMPDNTTISTVVQPIFNNFGTVIPITTELTNSLENALLLANKNSKHETYKADTKDHYLYKSDEPASPED